MFKAPFNPVTGLGLGVSYSSLNQIGEIFPQSGIGQAQLKMYVNAVSGNIVIKDHTVVVEEISGPLKLGFVYNSQSSQTNPWQFAIKKLTQIPLTNPFSQTVVLQEEDGHLTTYNLGAQNVYSAPGLNDGIPYFIYDQTSGFFRWYHPKTQITECFDPKTGLLMQRIDQLGHVTHFQYDSNNNLNIIIGPTGNTYQINRTNNSITLYDTTGGQQNVLQTYGLDNQGRINTTQTPSGYKINYTYWPNNNNIQTVTQDDGTNLVLGYQAASDGTQQLANFRLGTEIKYTINYASVQNPNQATMVDGYGSQTTLNYDQNGRTTGLSQQTGYVGAANPQVDTTLYTYNNQGQLQSQTNPNSGQTSYQYNGPFGLMSQKTDPSGQITQYNWFNNPGSTVPTQLISKTQILNGQPLTSYYVYDNDYDQQGHVFLRFEISPQGRVKEYLPNINSGTVATIKRYTNGIFNIAILNPTIPIALQQLTNWTALQNAQQITRTDYTYDTRGQVASTTSYANVDQNGNGIADNAMGLVETFWDEFGNLLTKTVKQTTTEDAQTNQRFDDLQRLTKSVDALTNETDYQYTPQNGAIQVKTTLPNGRTDTSTLDSSGLAANIVSVATSNNQSQTRLTTFQRDSAGRTVITTLPDQNKVYTFYDKQNRLGYKVSPIGIVTQYQYDRVHSYKTTTVYNATIDTSKLSPPGPIILPTVSMLLPLIQPSASDRTSFEFYDLYGRLNYVVDSANYITQTLYDQLNRKIGSISYANPLSAAQLLQLQQNQPLNPPLNYNSNEDRCARIFYDNDNNKIGKQDSAGYVTQYVRDAAGRVLFKIRYATPVTPNFAINNFDQIVPDSSSQDAWTYYFYDARSQRLAEVDADGYLTTHTYLPCGLKQQSLRYANKIAVSWFANPAVMPPLPQTSTEDQTTVYTYDLLSRPTEIDGPMQQASIKQYDVMSNLILNQIQDLANPTNVAPDYQRNTQAQYDGWNQVTAEANPFVGLAIVQIQTDQNLTPQQQQQQILQIWQTQSTRQTYDATGLKLYSTDSLNNITYYYYDNDRRLIITVDPTGCVIEKTLNSFGEPILNRAYAARIPEEQLATLTGGFIAASFRTYLNTLQISFDQVTQQVFDQRGLVTQVTDPENFITVNTYNAFKQIATENLPVATTQPGLLIAHQYDPRGLETQTTKTAGSLVTITSQVFANLYGKRTQYTDERGTIFVTGYDPLGQINSQISAYSTLLQATTTFINDAFNRVLFETDSLGEQTQHIYVQTNRTHEIIYPDPNVNKTITLNVFNKKQQEVDALSNTQSWAYAADGQINIYTDPLQCTTIDTYDLLGRRTLHTDQNNIKTSYAYNGSSQITKEIYDVDVGGLNLITIYIPDPFGNASIIDPRIILTANTFDRRNLLIQSVIDPSADSYTGLNLTTANTYNGQKTLFGKTVGDNTNLNQYQEAYPLDGLNRPTGKIIDPITPTIQQGLNITTADTLDVSGLVVAEADPNGNITRTFYDSLKRKRFAVNPLGGVVEWNYDSENRTTYVRHYQQAIDATQLSNQTTLATLMTLVTANNQLDTVEWFFYDQAGHERFKIKNLGNNSSGTNQGIVSTKNYDTAYRLISTTLYATPIDITNISAFSTAQLVTLMEENMDSTNDRTTYNILDAKGQSCFIIDPVGVVTLQVFDNKGQIITKTIFANPVANPAQIALLPVAQILAQITQDPVNDQTTYQVFDSRGKPQFVVDPEGNVYRYDHDPNGNLVKQYQLSKPITTPSDYASLVILLNSLVPNSAVDAITQRVYDNGNRLITLTDALQNSDSYKLDALGNTRIHIDRNNAQWIYQPDRANRLVLEATPSVTLTQVTSTVTNNQAQLSYSQSLAAIQKQTNYDSVGNQKSIIDGYGGSEPRTLQFNYNGCNKLQSSVIQNVAIDNPSQPASFTTRPEQIVTLTTTFVYNAKQLKVAQQNNAGYWHFYIYDAADRLVYEVDEQNAVTYYQRNVFGDITQKILYATPTTLNVSQYTQSGIPLAVIQQNVTTSLSDRTVVYVVDRRGDTLLETYAPIFYYIANQAGPASGTANPQTQKKYDAFRRCYFVAKLFNPSQSPPLWTQALTWFNRNGKPLAECDSINRVKTYGYDAFSNQIQITEYAKPPTQVPTLTTTLAQFLVTLQSDPTDRIYVNVYDLLQQKNLESITNQVVQQLNFNANNQPSLQNLALQSLTKKYQYSPTQKKIAITYEDGSTEYSYFDFRGSLIAEAGVPRQSQDAQKNPVTVIPLTVYGYNSFAQQVLKCAYQLGTAQATINQLPVPIATNPGDQYTITLFDNRGLFSYQQDPENNVTAFTFSPTRKPAREYSLLTTWQPGNVSVIHTDEKRYQFDSVDNILLVTILRDNGIVQMTQAQYDVFRNVIQEGPGNNNWQVNYFYDTQNKCWKTNYKNATWTIQLTNLLSYPTASFQSAINDLSQVSYASLPAILTWNATQIETTSSDLDYAGRVLARNYPVFSQANLTSNIPLNLYIISVNGKTLITWTLPQETNFRQELMVTPSRGTTKSIRLYIQFDSVNKYCFADVSNLPTDTYVFSLIYKIHLPYPWLPEPSTYCVSSGTIQFDTNNTQGSSSLVAIVQSSNQLKLTGNTANLTSIQLCQGNTVVATIPVQLNSSQQAIVDLSSYPSGQFTVNALVNNNFTGLSSLPFTIYTSTPANTPISRQLDCSTTLLTLDTHVQLVWTVPTDYAGLSVQMTCKYLGTDGNSYSYSGTAAPGVYLATYKDSNGNKLYCNAEFAQPIQSIQSLSVWLVLDAQNTLLPLEIDLAPQASKTVIPKSLKPKVTELAADWELVSAENSSKSKNVAVAANNVIQSYTFPSRSVVYIAPINDPTNYSSLTYFNTSLGSLAKWVPYPILGAVNPSQPRQSLASNVADAPGVVIDVTSMFLPGIYPCSIGEISTSFSVGDQGLLFYIGQGTNTNIAMQPRRVSQYDAWNNKIYDQDALNNVTLSTYTYRNKLASLLQPAVPVINENGTSTTLQPLTTYGYNQCGYLLGVCDANNHTQGYSVDAAGQQQTKILASGVTNYTQVFDALGRIPYYYDSRGMLTTKTYNRLNQVLTSSSPLGNVTAYLYDEQNRRRMQSLPGGLVYLYNYDPLSNLQSAYQPQDQLTTYTYDHNHLLLEQYNPDESSQIWSRNYGGIKLKYTDIGGAQYSYYYDLKWQLTQETSVGGDHGTYLRFTTVDVTKKGDIYYYFLFEPLPGKNVTYQYSAGHLMQVTDNVQGQVTQNFYDLNFAGIGQTVTIAGGTSRNVYSTLDALGREILVYDSGATVTTGYDAVGNRRYVTLSVYDSYNNPPTPNVTTNNWNIFDADDNVLIYNGILVNGQVIITEGQGIEFTYQNNFRASQKAYSFALTPPSKFPSFRLVTTQLNYTNDGLLWTTSGTDGSQSTRTYTPASWLNSYVQTGGSTPGSFSTTYYPNGWQYLLTSSQNGKSGTTNFGNFTPVGLSKSQVSSYSNGLTVNLSNVSYVGFDSWQIGLMSGSTTYKGKTTPYAGSFMIYTTSGYPNWKLLEGNGAAFVTQYTPTPDGLITTQTTWTATQSLAQIIGDNTVCIEMNQIPTGSRYFYTVNGQPLGSVSGTTVAQVNYMPPVSDSYPPPVPGLYVVNEGDTFASIASMEYMDSSYAGAIAAANNLSMNSPLTPGYTLVLPQQLAMQNSIYTSVPYNQFVQTIIGSLQGQVVLPPKEHHESFLRTLAEIIVVGAVAIVTGGIGGALAGAALASEGLVAGIAVAAATGAITSAITQGIAIGFGMQETFSFKAMFISAVEAGLAEGFVGTGLMPNPAAGAAAISQFSAWELVLSNGLNDTMDQLMQMATGMQKQFDLRQLFSAMIVQTTSQELVVAGQPTSAMLNSSGTDSLRQLSVEVINNQYGYRAVDDVNEVVLGDVIGNQHQTVKQLATEYLGTFAGQVLGNAALAQAPLSNVINSLTRYTQAAQDSAAAANNSSNRYGFFSSGSNAGSNSNNSANASNAQNQASTTNGSSNGSPSTTPAPTAPSGVLSGGASNSQVTSTGVNASGVPSISTPNFSLPGSVVGGSANLDSLITKYFGDVENELIDPSNWEEAILGSTLDHIAEVSEGLQADYLQSAQLFAGRGYLSSLQAGLIAQEGEVSDLSLEMLQNANFNLTIASRYGFFASRFGIVSASAAGLSGAMEFIDPVVALWNASSINRNQVLMEQSFDLAGEAAAMTITNLIIDPGTLGLGAAVAIPVGVGIGALLKPVMTGLADITYNAETDLLTNSGQPRASA